MEGLQRQSCFCCIFCLTGSYQWLRYCICVVLSYYWHPHWQISWICITDVSLLCRNIFQHKRWCWSWSTNMQWCNWYLTTSCYLLDISPLPATKLLTSRAAPSYCTGLLSIMKAICKSGYTNWKTWMVDYFNSGLLTIFGGTKLEPNKYFLTYFLFNLERDK